MTEYLQNYASWDAELTMRVWAHFDAFERSERARRRRLVIRVALIVVIVIAVALLTVRG